MADDHKTVAQNLVTAWATTAPTTTGTITLTVGDTPINPVYTIKARIDDVHEENRRLRDQVQQLTGERDRLRALKDGRIRYLEGTIDAAYRWIAGLPACRSCRRSTRDESIATQREVLALLTVLRQALGKDQK